MSAEERFDLAQYRATLKAIREQRVVVYGPRVLVLRDKPEEKTAGGLIIPDSAQKRKRAGTVVALGEGYAASAEVEYVKGLEIGHRVTFNSYDGVAQDLDTVVGWVEVLAMHVGQLYMGWPNRHLKEDK